MKSIFDLPQSVGELPSLNQGMSNLSYEQVPPLKSIQGTSFPGGRIEHRFELSGNRWWIPSRSYIRLRASLTNGDGTLIEMKDDKAPNMGVMGNLFQSMEFKIAQKVVSRISDRVAQVDALYNRLNYSKSQLDAWGSSTNWWQPSYDVRKALCAADGFVNCDCTVGIETNVAVNLDRVGQGYDDAAAANSNSIAIGNNNGIITFAKNGGADIADLTAVHTIGSTITYLGVVYTVTAYNFVDVNAATATVIPLVVGGIAAASNVDWFVNDAQVNEGASNKNQSPQRCNLEFIWRPPLGIFSCPYALPAGRYELKIY